MSCFCAPRLDHLSSVEGAFKNVAGPYRQVGQKKPERTFVLSLFPRFLGFLLLLLMSRFALALLVLWGLFGIGLYEMHDPASHVWNGNAEALRRVAPPLRTLEAASLLLWFGAGVAGYVLLTRTAGKRQAFGAALLLGAWVGAQRGAQHYLAAEEYTVWKYAVTDEETQAVNFPAIQAQLLPTVVWDVQNPAESLPFRSALAAALGHARIQGAYAALQAVAENPRQDPYLQLQCLKALRLLRPQQFTNRFLAASDSARALYQRYEPDKP